MYTMPVGVAGWGPDDHVIFHYPPKLAVLVMTCKVLDIKELK
jgi:hypothetical protein